MFTVRPTWFLGALLGLLVACSGANAGESTDEAGKMLFLHYCSSCHGTSGKGDGAIAAILQVKPADLTQLAKKGGKEFSYLSLLQSIDGRKTVRGHGSPGMPVWGQVFAVAPDAPVGEQLQAAGKLLLITYYVESLQEK